MTRRLPSPAVTAIACAIPLAPGAALANMARATSEGEQHGPLVPQSSTGVRVDDEKLSFEIADDLASAEVRAAYRLTNAGTAREASDVAFAFVRAEHDERAAPRASIEVDGAPVAAEVTTDADLLERGLRSFLGAHPEIARALASGEADAALARLVADAGGSCARGCEALRAYHADAKGGATSTWTRELHVLEAAEEAIPAASASLHRGFSTLPTRRRMGFVIFHLDLAAGQTRAVTVRYTHAPTLDKGLRVPTTFAYEYLLSPAKRWASFGPLEITVRAPAHATVEGAVVDGGAPVGHPVAFPSQASGTRPNLSPPQTSPIALHREGEVHRASLPGLPDGELRIAAYSKRHLWFGWTDPARYWTVVLAAASLAIIAAGAVTGRFWRSLTRWKELLLRVLVAGPFASIAALAAMLLASLPMPERALGYGYGAIFGSALVALAAVPLGAIVSFVAAGIGRRRPPAPLA